MRQNCPLEKKGPSNLQNGKLCLLHLIASHGVLLLQNLLGRKDCLHLASQFDNDWEKVGLEQLLFNIIQDGLGISWEMETTD